MQFLLSKPRGLRGSRAADYFSYCAYFFAKNDIRSANRGSLENTSIGS